MFQCENLAGIRCFFLWVCTGFSKAWLLRFVGYDRRLRSAIFAVRISRGFAILIPIRHVFGYGRKGVDLFTHSILRMESSLINVFPARSRLAFVPRSAQGAAPGGAAGAAPASTPRSTNSINTTKKNE